MPKADAPVNLMYTCRNCERVEVVYRRQARCPNCRQAYSGRGNCVLTQAEPSLIEPGKDPLQRLAEKAELFDD